MPQGSWESNPEADPLTVAQGEQARKPAFKRLTWSSSAISSKATAIRTRGAISSWPGSFTQQARDLDHEEQGLICRRFPACEVMAMIASGQIRDAITVAAIGLLVMRGLLPQAFDLPR